jgi:hypothetical protein
MHADGMPHIFGKALDEGYNFDLNLISIRGLQKQLWASKVTRIFISKNSRIPYLGILRQTNIWVEAPWPGIKNTIRGKVVAFPKFGPW